MFAKVFQLVSSLASAQSAIQDMQIKMQYAARRSMLFAVAGFIALAAAALFLAALWLWLASHYGAMIANLAIGGGLLVVAVIVAVIAANLGKGMHPPPQATVAGDANAQISELLSELEALGKDDGNSLKALAMAALIGVVIAKLLWR